MKKITFLLVLLACFAFAKAQDIDSLYHAFERNRGELAYRAAVAIDEAIGREPNFDADTDKDEIKLKLLRTMILHFFNTNDFQHVVQYSEIGIAHYARIGDLFNEAGCYMTLANAYQRLGQLDKSIDCYNHCSDLMDEMGGEMASVNKRYVINNIAEIHLAMDEYDRAGMMYNRCIDMLGDIDVNDTASNLDMATYLQNLAEVRIAQARIRNDKMQLDEAVNYAERSLELSQSYHDSPHKVINRLMTLSKAYEKKDEAAEKVKSAQLLDEALKLAEDNNEIFLQAVIHLQRGDYAKAIAMAEENHYDKLLQDALETAYQQERDKNPKEALEYYERSMAMKDSIFNETQQQLIRDYQVRYAMQEKEYELQMQQEKTKRNQLYVIVLAIVAVLFGVIAVIWYRLALIRKKRNDELRKLNATKDRLLSIVSHDVRTPVGAMSQVLRDLTSDYDTLTDTDRKAKLVMLRSSSEALNDRMENILQWVRGELGNSKIEPTAFNLAQLVDECIRMQEAVIEVKMLKVSNKIPRTLSVYDDANVVSLVLQNLLSNAVKFSYPNGEISIEAQQKGQRVWVSVSDNGMGISEKKLEKIFNFMTTSAVGTDGETGTGIGLFVCKQLVDRMGGEITIESVKGEGTSVKFSVGV